MTEHIENIRETQRREFLAMRMYKGRPRVFNNYIETNAN